MFTSAAINNKTYVCCFISINPYIMVFTLGMMEEERKKENNSIVSLYC